MRFSPFIRTAVALLPLTMAVSPAASQPARGELGAQSRSSIRISVTVMPRFHVLEGVRAPGITSNAPTIRYSLVIQRPNVAVTGLSEPTNSGKAAASDSGAPQYPLMLVVPD